MLCLAQLTKMLPGYSNDSSRALMLGTEFLMGLESISTKVDWDGAGSLSWYMQFGTDCSPSRS